MNQQTKDARHLASSSENVRKGEVKSQPVVVDTRNLFGDSREICLCHDGALYRLKITRQGKLILNK